MKIGILTFHRSQNYGALLQAFGLQQYLKSLGYDVSIVDYWPSYHDQMYKLFSWEKFKNLSLKGKIKYIYNSIGTCIRLPIRQKNTRQFINKYLQISRDTHYDLLIYGSDQIWRKQHQPNFEWYNPVYFGNGFVDAPHKISYAASMGDIEAEDEKDYDFLKTNLANFDAISVREDDLKKFIEQAFNYSCKLVIDPVLLLSKEQWGEIVNRDCIPKEKYILYYRLQNISETDIIANEISKQSGLQIIELRGYVPVGHYGSRYNFTTNAQGLISLISGADYIVTSSFHGVALSVRFEKNFYISSNIRKPNRVKTLLSSIGLTNRMIDIDQLKSVNLLDGIDYIAVNKKLSVIENDSRRWLGFNISMNVQ